MIRFRKNKSELIVLTGAIYSFVAYLTAFTLEILFLIDLTRRNNDILSTSSTAPNPSSRIGSSSTPAASNNHASISSGSDIDDYLGGGSLAASFNRFTFEAMQAHITISCLAISILYFVIFITSLILIVALILRSTFILLIWMCAMTTMYLPEFGLVTYVSVYSWGLDTRNGQVELAFYLFRAALNLIFVFRAHKLFKQWNYEKSFFRLKSGRISGGGGGGAASHFTGYDSPYFITGDSLTTTINPMFSSSTLNLNRYDYVRSDELTNKYNQVGAAGGGGGSRNASPATNQSVFSSSLDTATAADSSQHSGSMAGGRGRLAVASAYSRELANQHAAAVGVAGGAVGKQSPPGKFYLSHEHLGDDDVVPSRHSNRPTSASNKQMSQRNESMLSINDADLDADYEMDLDYRTLNKNSHGTRLATPTNQQQQQVVVPSVRYQHHHDHQRRYRPEAAHQYNQPVMMGGSQDNLAYSTQSLDRRHLRDFGLIEQVVLRPLGHQPFEYLQRPGSTSNLNTIGTNPNANGGNTLTQKRDHQHYQYGNYH